MDKEFARMQHHPVALTEAGKRAMQQYYYPWSGKEYPHKWLKWNKDTWIFTNEGIYQYKALVIKLPSGRYRGTIRTMSRMGTMGNIELASLEDVQAWAAVSVYDLIQQGFDFYGPDKVE